MAGATTTQRKYSALDEKGLRRTSLHIVSGDGEVSEPLFQFCINRFPVPANRQCRPKAH